MPRHVIPVRSARARPALDVERYNDSACPGVPTGAARVEVCWYPTRVEQQLRPLPPKPVAVQVVAVVKGNRVAAGRGDVGPSEAVIGPRVTACLPMPDHPVAQHVVISLPVLPAEVILRPMCGPHPARALVVRDQFKRPRKVGSTVRLKDRRA